MKWKNNRISIKRDYFIQANKYLNVVGGAMILDMLTTEEIEEMVDQYLTRHYALEDQTGAEPIFGCVLHPKS